MHLTLNTLNPNGGLINIDDLHAVVEKLDIIASSVKPRVVVECTKYFPYTLVHSL